MQRSLGWCLLRNISKTCCFQNVQSANVCWSLRREVFYGMSAFRSSWSLAHSMDWRKGKSTGKERKTLFFSSKTFGLPVDVPLNRDPKLPTRWAFPEASVDELTKWWGCLLSPQVYVEVENHPVFSPSKGLFPLPWLFQGDYFLQWRRINSRKRFG